MTNDNEHGTDGAMTCPAEALLDLFEWPVAGTSPSLPDADEALGGGQVHCQRDYRIRGTLLARLSSDQLVVDQLRREAGLSKAPGWRYRLIEVIRHVRRVNWQERQFKQLWLEEWILSWDYEMNVGIRRIDCDRCGRAAGLSLVRTQAAVCFRCVSCEDL